MATTEDILQGTGNPKRETIHKEVTLKCHSEVPKALLFQVFFPYRYLASNDSHKELLKKILLSDDDSRANQESEQRRERRREPPTRFFDRRRSNANAN